MVGLSGPLEQGLSSFNQERCCSSFKAIATVRAQSLKPLTWAKVPAQPRDYEVGKSGVGPGEPWG